LISRVLGAEDGQIADLIGGDCVKLRDSAVGFRLAKERLPLAFSDKAATKEPVMGSRKIACW
jgi:hypothetical protein